MNIKKFLSKNIKNISYCVLAFVISLLMFVFSYATVLQITFLNSDYLMDSMNKVSYFTDKKDEVIESLTDLGFASGLKKEFFEEFVSEVMINEDTNKYFADYYSGKSTHVDTTDFKQKFNEAIKKYIEKNNLYSTDEKMVENLVNEAANIYRTSLEVPLFTRIAPYMMSMRGYMPMVIGGSGVLILALVAVIYFTNKWKHRAIRYMVYATAGSFLSVSIVPAFLLVTKSMNKINLSSRALYHMFVEAVNNFFMDVLLFGIFFIVLSVALYCWYAYKRKKLTDN